MLALGMPVSECSARRAVEKGVYQVENGQSNFCDLFGEIFGFHGTNAGQNIGCCRWIKMVHVYQTGEGVCGGGKVCIVELVHGTEESYE